MRQYKLFLILKSHLKETERKKILSEIKDFLGKVKMEKEEDLGQKPLAYPIKREVSGVFAKLEFEAEQLVSGLEKKLDTNDNILRHLLLRQ